MAGGSARQVGRYLDVRLARAERPAAVEAEVAAAAQADAGAEAPAVAAEVPAAVQVEAPAAGWQAQEVAWTAAIYLAQVLGVVGKQVYDAVAAGKGVGLQPATLVVAVIVSAVCFPLVYHNMQAETKPGLRLFLAFQNGFFWQSLLAGLAPQ